MVSLDWVRLAKILALTTPFPSVLNIFDTAPIQNIIHLPFNATVTAGHFDRITEEIILHSQVWEPSAKQEVIDHILRMHSPL